MADAMKLTDLIEEQADNFACGLQDHNFLRGDDGSEPLGREMIRLNLEQFAKRLAASPPAREEAPAEGAGDDLISRLEGEPGDCPFCGRDPYHYVDNGVGMERVAVTCCDEGIAYFQHGDPVLTEQISLRREAADALRDRTSAREVGRPDDYEGPDAGMHDTEIVERDND